MAYIAFANGTRQEVTMPVSLKHAQDIVGGYVERVHPIASPDILFLCNEDGLNIGLPRNQHGCDLYKGASPIVGDIIVMRKGEAGAVDWI